MIFKQYLKQKNVLIVSNGDFYPTSPLITSIKTYSQIIDNNFYIVPCTIGNKKIYGLEAFYHILLYANSLKYDYVLYIDADCFILNLNNLYSEFKNFVESDNIIKGTADGGCFCHRNLNNYVINPFLSFYNIKKISKYIKDNKFELTNMFNIQKISEITKINNKKVLNAVKIYNELNNPVNKHAQMISKEHNQYENFFGSKQIPFSCNYKNVYDQYYYLYYIFLNASENYDYFYGRDYIGQADDSGISSALFIDKEMNDDSIICIHTWFTRCTELQYVNSNIQPYASQFKRIKKVEKFVELKNEIK